MAKYLLHCFILLSMSASAQQQPWYHHTTIYQIYPRSFYDSNGDGIGDIQGIIQKLDHVKDMGYQTIWCSPFFKSPQKDFGYDISDYQAIAPEYGTMQDAEQLIAEVHKRGMRIVFDMVMNHTSIEHPWFKADVERGKADSTKDYYIWRDKPTNWKSMTGGSGWQYNAQRKQYFYASFLPFQPDLNYRNPVVKETMLNNVRYWLKKGVDGFRLDIFNVIYKDGQFRNNPFMMKAVPSESDPSGFFQKAKYTINQQESFAFAKELRAVCNEFGDKMLLGEVSGDKATIKKFMGDDKNDGLGLVFNFEMLRYKMKASYFHELIEGIEQNFAEPFMPVYVFSNHDRRRSIRRINNDMQKARLLHLMQLTVRGVPCMYYGEELGMTDGHMPYKTALDPIPHKYNIPRFMVDMNGETLNRDELRTPMQWSDTVNAGFSASNKTWLPVNPDYKTVNVATENAVRNSLMNSVKALLLLRKQHSIFAHGSLKLIDKKLLPKNVLGYTRSYNGNEVLVLINYSKSNKLVKLPKAYSTALYQTDINSNKKGDSVQLSPLGGIVLM